jgi:hypothetical protein
MLGEFVYQLGIDHAADNSQPVGACPAPWPRLLYRDNIGVFVVNEDDPLRAASQKRIGAPKWCAKAVHGANADPKQCSGFEERAFMAPEKNTSVCLY